MSSLSFVDYAYGSQGLFLLWSGLQFLLVPMGAVAEPEMLKGSKVEVMFALGYVVLVWSSYLRPWQALSFNSISSPSSALIFRQPCSVQKLTFQLQTSCDFHGHLYDDQCCATATISDVACACHPDAGSSTLLQHERLQRSCHL